MKILLAKEQGALSPDTSTIRNLPSRITGRVYAWCNSSASWIRKFNPKAATPNQYSQSAHCSGEGPWLCLLSDGGRDRFCCADSSGTIPVCNNDSAGNTTE